MTTYKEGRFLIKAKVNRGEGGVCHLADWKEEANLIQVFD